VKFLNRYFFAGVGTGCLLSVLLTVGVTFGFGYYAMRTMGDRMDGGSSGSALRAPELPPDDRALTAYGEADWDWTLQTLDGENVTLGDFQGQVVFLTLWATWCGPCKRELPHVQALHDSLSSEGVAFLLVSREKPETVMEFLETEEYDLPFYTRTGDLPADLYSRAVPTTFIIDSQGTVVINERGARAWDDESAIAFLRRLLEEEA
jgi:peroxiredoxin